MRKLSLVLVVVLLFAVAGDAVAEEPSTVQIHDFYRGFGESCLEVSKPGVQLVGKWAHPGLIYYGWTLIDLQPASEVYISLYEWDCRWWHCEAVKEVGDGQPFILEGGSYLIIGGEEPVADHVEVLRFDAPLPFHPGYIKVGPRGPGGRAITAFLSLTTAEVFSLGPSDWHWDDDGPAPKLPHKQTILVGEVVAEVHCLTSWPSIPRGQSF